MADDAKDLAIGLTDKSKLYATWLASLGRRVPSHMETWLAGYDASQVRAKAICTRPDVCTCECGSAAKDTSL